MPDLAMLWKLWTPQNFMDAHYCEDCGLPMFEIVEQDNSRYICVYCELKSDKEISLENEVNRLKRENSLLQNALTSGIIRDTPDRMDICDE